MEAGPLPGPEQLELHKRASQARSPGKTRWERLQGAALNNDDDPSTEVWPQS